MALVIIHLISDFSMLSFLCLFFRKKMSDDENRDEGAGLHRQPQVTVKSPVVRWGFNYCESSERGNPSKCE